MAGFVDICLDSGNITCFHESQVVFMVVRSRSEELAGSEDVAGSEDLVGSEELAGWLDLRMWQVLARSGRLENRLGANVEKWFLGAFCYKKYPV